MEEHSPQFCPTCGRFIPDRATRRRVAKFAADGIDLGHLAESVTFDPMAEPEPRVILISTINGPVKITLAACIPVMVGSAVAFQYGVISGPLASMLMIGSFSAFLLMLGGNPKVLQSTASAVEVAPAQPVDEPVVPNADEVTLPHPHSMQIRFYEPPIRPSGIPVPWEGICYACREALNGRPFSIREIACRKGSRISEPDFRLLAADFRRRGYTEMAPNGKTGFTERGRTQVVKISQLPY